MTTDKKPFEVCPTCGTPKLEQASKILVLYFATDADRDEFIAAAKEAKPSLQSYKVD